MALKAAIEGRYAITITEREWWTLTQGWALYAEPDEAYIPAGIIIGGLEVFAPYY